MSDAQILNDSAPETRPLEERKYLLDVYRIFADQIIKEDSLTNHRVTWGIAINGGLIALLGAFYQAFKDLPHFGVFVVTLLLATAAAGVFVCYQTMSSTSAADKQLFRIRKKYIEKWQGEFRRLELPPPFAYIPGASEDEAVLGEDSGGWPRFIFGAIVLFWIFFCILGIAIVDRQEAENLRQCVAFVRGTHMNGPACAQR
jgi:hypothetical protein